MTSTEQHNIIKTLADYSHKLRGKESDEFEMMQKRDRDDEELDELTRRRLLEFYVKCVPERFR